MGIILDHLDEQEKKGIYEMKEVMAALAAIIIGTSASADVGSFLKDAAETTSQVSSAVNGPEKVSISDLKESGTKYLNKSIELEGTVVELKSRIEGSYLIVLSDENGNEINCTAAKAPDVKLDDKIKVTGSLNGRVLAISDIDDGNSLF